MIKFLFSLFGKTSKQQPVAAKSRPASVRQRGDYRAVSIASAGRRCAAAKDAAETRFLMREAPPLPLPVCTMAETCSCKFRKLPDRRDGDRRAFGGTEANLWYSGRNSRQGFSRRRSGG